VDVGVGLELPAPGMQNPGKPRKRCPDATLVFGEPFECLGRGIEESVVREALLRADKRAEGLRDGAGDEEVRPEQLFV